MINLARTVRADLTQLLTQRSWWVMTGFVTILQPFIAYVSVKQSVQLGLDATPETHPELATALPPIDYFGFDSVSFGILIMVILGCLVGATDFKHHQLRTLFLYQNKRSKAFFSKSLAFLIATICLACFSIILTIVITQIGLGNLGLHPLILSPTAWQFIGYAVVSWVLLTMLAFWLTLLCRHSLIPLLFFVPQVYGLGPYLAGKWDWGNYLPVTAGNMLFAIPGQSLVHQPIKGIIILSLWLVLVLILSVVTYVRRDVGGRY